MALAMSASSGFAKRLTVKARNLGADTEVTFNCSYGGGYVMAFKPLEFGLDSIAVINVSDADVERVDIVVKPANGKNKAVQLYLTEKETEIAIDPATDSFFNSFICISASDWNVLTKAIFPKTSGASKALWGKYS